VLSLVCFFLISKQFIPSFLEASKYELTNGIEFISVNCKNKQICDHFKVKGYPTIQLYMKGVLQQYEVPRQLEALLEFIDKLLSPDIIPIQQDEISHFSNSYGEVSFLLISQEDNSEIVNCVQEIAKENKPYIFFSQLKLNTYTTKSGLILNSPAIMVFY